MISKIKQFFTKKTYTATTIDSFKTVINPVDILDKLELDNAKKSEWKEHFKKLPKIKVNLGYMITQDGDRFRRHIERNWINEVNLNGIENCTIPKEFIEEVRQTAVNMAFDQLYEEFRIMGRWL